VAERPAVLALLRETKRPRLRHLSAAWRTPATETLTCIGVAACNEKPAHLNLGTAGAKKSRCAGCWAMLNFLCPWSGLQKIDCLRSLVRFCRNQRATLMAGLRDVGPRQRTLFQRDPG
jgi:hypothetical protein